MRVTRQDNIVANVVGLKVVEGTIAVCLVTIPSIVVKRVDVTVSERLVDTRED